MATKTQITAEQYLSTPYEWEPEFVGGEIVERPLPTKRHSKIRQRLSVLLDSVGCCYPELRIRVAQDRYRIPDLCVFNEEPEDEVPATPPLLVIEILSPDDRHHELMEKLEEYRAWGVANIWIVDPELKKFYVYDRGLIEKDRLELRDLGFSIEPASVLFH
jgi:Uma2 family endonuclease